MLSHNKLTDWPGAVLGSIPSLQELHLAYNPFREVQSTFSNVVYLY
jgi:Leucine-rich repeat (LRR) protein